MGLTDLISDIYASLSWTEAHAEAAAEDQGDDSEDSEGGEESKGEDEEGGDDSEEKGGDDEEEEEEEEEEEPEDPKPKLEEECANSSQCSGAKHHFEECVERVTAQKEDEEYKGPHEDCVEEFFHLQHCATQCAAPKLFRLLK